MREDIILRLASLGYQVEGTADDWVLSFLIQKIENTIKNACNVTAIPDRLIPIAVDMVCGEFLQSKKASGQLDGFQVDLSEVALKQVQEGDTSVSFSHDGNSTPEQRLDAVIRHLMTDGREQFATYRRLSW